MQKQPTDPELHQAELEISQGNFSVAYQYSSKFLSRQPNHFQGLFIAAGSAMQLQKMDTAIQLFEKALDVKPERHDVKALLSRCYLAVHNLLKAKELALAALKSKNLPLQGLLSASVVLSHCGAHKTALNGFQKAVKKAPNQPEVIYNLASAYKFTGNFKAAESAYERAISLRPDYAEAHAALADLPNSKMANQRIARLEQYLGKDIINKGDKLEYALARELERLGNYSQAFDAFERSANIRAQNNQYSIDTDREIFTTVEKVWEQFESARESVESTSANQPIFVFGMPRTGTTLLERIISSHSMVHSCGELNYIPAIMKQLSGTNSSQAVSVSVLEKMLRVDPQQLAQQYLALVSKMHNVNGRFVDKLPINYFYLPVLVNAFPDACFFVLRRNPMDTVLSNYRQLFAEQSVHQYYSNSLIDCAQYLIGFDKLIKTSKALMGERLFEVSYEKLVSQPGELIPSILSHCGLATEKACIDVHLNVEPLATASAYQARQAINTNSVNRWQFYESRLQPVVELFDKNDIFYR